MIILTPSQKIFADETYVYCSTIKKQWNWLNNKSVKVSGEWKVKELKNIRFIRYFKIDGGVNFVKELQNLCKNEFGQHYLYAQPAKSALEDWYVFGYEDGSLEPGINTYINFYPRFR